MFYTVNQLPDKIYFNHGGENLVTVYQFDFSDWARRYGEGTFFIKVQLPHANEAYVATGVTVSGHIATWHITNVETSVPGIGKCELNYVVDETHRKSAVIATNCSVPLPYEGEVPSAYEDWLVQLGNLAHDAQTSAEGAQNALEQMESVTATAETLPPGESATAEFNDWQLVFGIPSGERGVQGETGNGIDSAILNPDYTLTLNFTDGTSYTTTSIRGETGATGQTGAAGVGILSITKTGTVGNVDTYTVTMTDGSEYTFSVTNGLNGTDGADGFSPTATVSKSGGVSTITITDETGTTTAQVSDGTDGQDGFSPTATVSKSGNTSTITITDKNGTTSVEINDSQKVYVNVDLVEETADKTIGDILEAYANNARIWFSGTADGYEFTIPLVLINGREDQGVNVYFLEATGTIDGLGEQFDGRYCISMSGTDDSDAISFSFIPKTQPGEWFDIPVEITDDSNGYRATTEVTPMDVAQAIDDGNELRAVMDYDGATLEIKATPQKVSVPGIGNLYFPTFSVLSPSYNASGLIFTFTLGNDDDLYEPYLIDVKICNFTDYVTWNETDYVPTLNSSNLVRSGGVYDALATKITAPLGPSDDMILSYQDGAGWQATDLGSLLENTDARVVTVYEENNEYRIDDDFYDLAQYVQDARPVLFVLLENFSVYFLTLVDADLGNETLTLATVGGQSSNMTIYFSIGSNGGMVGVASTIATGEDKLDRISFANVGDVLVTVPDYDGSSGKHWEAKSAAPLSAAFPYGEVDVTSTSTAFTATIPGITEYRDGTTVMLKNGMVTSESGFTININGLGAKPCYSNMATGNGSTAPTRDTTIFNINYTMLFVYSSTIVNGGGWICYRGFDSNTNTDTIGYQIRINSSSLPMDSIVYRYRLLFCNADCSKYVPANNSNSTNATSVRAACQTPINPFGPIYYFSGTGSVAAGGRPAASNLWQQYVLNIGYSFNWTGSGATMTGWKPVYLKCTPQSDGSAIIDSSTPYVQDLPTTEDGKIYIWLGVAYAAASLELTLEHPVFYYKNGGVRLWTNAVVTGGGAVDSVNGQTGTVVIDAEDVGAIAAPSSPTTGSFLVWNGSAWVAQTLSTWQGGNY